MDSVIKLLRERYPKSSPGAAVFVQNGDKELLAAFGDADVQRQVPMTVENQFDLASLTKQFTAFAMFELIRQSKLSLTDDVARFLPLNRAFEATPTRAKIKDLIFHTSGFPDYTDLPASQFSSFDNAQVLEWLNTQSSLFSPGSRGCMCAEDYQPENYSNTNYVLLALLIENVTGVSFGQALKNLIFTPLGMTSTEIDSVIVANPRRAIRYGANGRPRRSKPSPTVGDGALFSTIQDMARWIKSLREFVRDPERSFEKYLIPGRLNSGQATRYAFGWQIHSRSQGQFLYHDGKWNGVTSCAMHWVERRSSIVVLSHCEKPAAFTTAEEIADKLHLEWR